MAPIDDAIAEARSQEFPNLTQIAKTHGVNRTTLSRRFRGVTQSKQQGNEYRRFLTIAQEDELIKYINKLSGSGIPPTPRMVQNFAEEMAKKECSKNWVARFTKRHRKELKSIYLTGMDLNRKKAESYANIERYFKLVCGSINCKNGAKNS